MLSQAIHIELEECQVLETSRTQKTLDSSHAFACGKVILVGEHAVVYGAHALAIPVPSMRLDVHLQTVQDDVYPRRKNKTSVSDNLQLVLKDALQLLNIDPVPLKIEGHSKILFGAGLGASAALCVSILRALSQCFGKKLDGFELASLANQLEKRFHGTPSGLDATTVALEKPLLFKKEKTPQILQTQAIRLEHQEYPWHFVIIDSDTRSPTLRMVQQTAPYFQGNEGAERVRLFDQAALQACEGLQAGDLHVVQEAMEKTHGLLEEIGVVPALLKNIMVRAKQSSGVLATKITGAGGGGCVLGLLDPRRAKETLLELRNTFGHSKVYDVILIGSSH